MLEVLYSILLIVFGILATLWIQTLLRRFSGPRLEILQTEEITGRLILSGRGEFEHRGYAVEVNNRGRSAASGCSSYLTINYPAGQTTAVPTLWTPSPGLGGVPWENNPIDIPPKTHKYCVIFFLVSDHQSPIHVPLGVDEKGGSPRRLELPLRSYDCCLKIIGPQVEISREFSVEPKNGRLKISWAK